MPRLVEDMFRAIREQARPARSKTSVLFLAARTLNANGPSERTLSLRQERVMGLAQGP